MDTPDQPDKPTGSYISPRLRDKLNEPSGGGRKDRDDDQLPPWLGWLVLGLLVVAGAFIAFGVMRSGAEKAARAQVAHADSLRAAAAADSAAAVMRDSLRADSLVAAAAPKPSPKPSPSATSGGASRPAAGGSSGTSAGGAAPAPAAETRHYGLIVGEYLDETRANSEKDRLSTATSLPGRVVSVDNGNAFRVILGSFAGRAAAEKAAADLSGKGLVSEARVTVLPK